MVHGVVRIQKVKVSDGGGLSKRIAHNLRECISDNIDPTRIELDEVYGATTRREIYDKIHEKWNQATARRSDNVGVLEVLVTTTAKLPQGREEDFLGDSIEQLKALYGADNLISAFIHRDEKETHIHAFVVPIEEKKVEKTRLTNQEEDKLKAELQKRQIEFQSVPKKPDKDADKESWENYKKQKKSYEKYKKTIKPIMEELGITKTETVLSCQKFCGSKESLSQFQDMWYNNVFKKYGLERGEKGKKRNKWKPAQLHKWQENLQKEIQNFNSHVNKYKAEKKKRINAILQMIQQGNYEKRDPSELMKDIMAMAEALTEKQQKKPKKSQNQERER